MCLRVSPGLLRHSCGPASCHTSSMAAKLGLALTQNSSPTPLANRRRVAQIAVSKGRAFGRPPQRAKFPRRARREIPNRPKRHPQMAQPLAKGHGPRRRPLWGGRWGPFFLLGVGAGIPDGPGWNVPWTRQGCRVLQNGYVFAPMRRSTLPSTARRHTPVPPYKRGRTAPLRLGAGTSSDTVQHKAAVHHPRWGGDSGLRRCRGLRHLRMAVWDA